MNHAGLCGQQLTSPQTTGNEITSHIDNECQSEHIEESRCPEGKRAVIFENIKKKLHQKVKGGIGDSSAFVDTKFDLLALRNSLRMWRRRRRR
jgi:hypothetical protein